LAPIDKQEMSTRPRFEVATLGVPPWRIVQGRWGLGELEGRLAGASFVAPS